MSYTINKNAEYFLWGCGEFGNQFYERFRDRIVIKGYIDSNCELWGKSLNGLPIISLDEISKNANVIITSSWYKEISKILLQKGFIEKRSFYDYYSFMVRYMQQEESTIYIPSVALTITERCSLRCKYCIARVPYIKNPINYDAKTLVDSLIPFFGRGGKIGDLLLSGGDAFCHPQLAEMLESICQKYLGNRIERVRIASNAVITPSQSILDLIKQYRMVVRITDYRESTNIQRIKEISDIILKHCGCGRVEIINQGQWLNVWREKLDYLNEEKRKKMFDMCRYTGSSLIKGGKFYSCCVAGYNNDDVSIDFAKIEKYSDEDIIRFIINGPVEKGYMFCSKCYGMTNSNRNYILKGEQL